MRLYDINRDVITLQKDIEEKPRSMKISLAALNLSSRLEAVRHILDGLRKEVEGDPGGN